MAAYNKFDIFVEDVLFDGIHVLFLSGGDQLNIALVNSPAPVATDDLLGDLTEITAGNGYTAGGEDTQNSAARSGGTVTITGTKVVWVASGGSIGPFRYVILYNQGTPQKTNPLIAWWDHGSGLTLSAGESFTVKFNSGDPTGTIFTFV